jgi:hypothetical protein
MIAFFVNERLAFGSKVRLQRHVETLQALGITHVIDTRYYPSKKLRKFKTINGAKAVRAARPCAQIVRGYQESSEAFLSQSNGKFPNE